MNEKDKRWMQRFSNYSKALNQLKEFIEKSNELNKLEKQGLIKAFEYTYELAWNTIKDFYEYQGEVGLQGSRDTFQLAFNRGIIKDGEAWMQMLKDRNQTSHIYNEEVADEIAENIINKYFLMFQSLKNSLDKQKR
ncbi:MAG: nucleotidyltransferase substrate binding protein [Bacteroidota bacterium]|nr:nucleotidyltransferase substrate binding protein [Bacteroidota bacterium]